MHHCLPPGKGADGIVEICPTSLFMSINTVYNVYMYMILMTFLPFLLLSILNALIMKRVKGGAPEGKLDFLISWEPVVFIFIKFEY